MNRFLIFLLSLLPHAELMSFSTMNCEAVHLDSRVYPI